MYKPKVAISCLLSCCLCSNPDQSIKPHDIYAFDSPRDVEIVARCARVWADRYTLDKGAIMMAEAVIKVSQYLCLEQGLPLQLSTSSVYCASGYPAKLYGIINISKGLPCASHWACVQPMHVFVEVDAALLQIDACYSQ